MARFMAITLIYEKIYDPLSRTMAKHSKETLSLMKRPIENGLLL